MLEGLHGGGEIGSTDEVKKAENPSATYLALEDANALKGDTHRCV